MPNRILRDGILDSLAVNRLSESAELFYRRLMSVVDDFGRCEADPVLLRVKLFPLRLEAWTVKRLTDVLHETVNTLTEGGNPLVTVYRQSNKNYLQINNFRQRLRSPVSRCPSPDGHMTVTKLNSTQDQADLPLCPPQREQVLEAEAEAEAEVYTAPASQSQSSGVLPAGVDFIIPAPVVSDRPKPNGVSTEDHGAFIKKSAPEPKNKIATMRATERLASILGEEPQYIDQTAPARRVVENPVERKAAEARVEAALRKERPDLDEAGIKRVLGRVKA